MASGGDTITYTFSGAKETEDISGITDITIQRMDGADGGDGSNSDSSGGSGGLVESATADVSNYDTLEIWVGGTGSDRFGRSNGGLNGDGGAGVGAGSTELWTDSNTVFIAAADGGGGGGDIIDGFGGTISKGGGGGARGGSGGTATGAENTYDGEDAEGSGFGGDGGDADYDNSIAEDGGDGGQELGIASGGTTTTGGSSAGDGEITIEFIAPPTAPSDLTLSLQ